MSPDPNDPNYSMFLRWRGVRTPCTKCNGSGVCIYSSTATWRGGMGGASMTRDVCDGCWGTGDQDRHGVDLRAQRDNWNHAVAKAAGELLSGSVGASLLVTRDAVEAIAGELEKMSNGRKPRPRFYYDIVTSLAKTLRKMVSDPK